jgi:hypothetical protein
MRGKPSQGFDMKREPNSAKWVNRKLKYILGSIFIWMNIVWFSMLDVSNVVHFIPKRPNQNKNLG